jgi:hypothetical protein
MSHCASEVEAQAGSQVEGAPRQHGVAVLREACKLGSPDHSVLSLRLSDDSSGGDGEELLRKFSWGCFRFTPKLPSDKYGRPCGAMQAMSLTFAVVITEVAQALVSQLPTGFNCGIACPSVVTIARRGFALSLIGMAWIQPETVCACWLERRWS